MKELKLTVPYQYGKVHYSVIHVLLWLMDERDNDYDAHLWLNGLFIREYAHRANLIEVARNIDLETIPPDDPTGIWWEQEPKR